MKKALRSIKGLPRKVTQRPKLLATLLLTLLIGFGIGNAFYAYVLQDNASSDQQVTRDKQAAQQRSSADKIKTSRERIEERINQDLERERITEEQAQQIRNKVDELQPQIQSIDRTVVEGRDQLRELRREVNAWARENDVSAQYFNRLFNP